MMKKKGWIGLIPSPSLRLLGRKQVREATDFRCSLSPLATLKSSGSVTYKFSLSLPFNKDCALQSSPY